MANALLSVLYGGLVGLSIGLTGVGGAILAVPLLVFGLALPPREAVGVSLVTVGMTAGVGFLQRWRAGLVEVVTGLVFAVAGMLGAPLGAWLSVRLPAPLLLLAFAGLMLVSAARMWPRTGAGSNQPPEESWPGSADELAVTAPSTLLLVAAGLATGVLAGLFGVGGGILIVPALVLFRSLSLPRAIGTSLLAITLISLSGSIAHWRSGTHVPWEILGLFLSGSLIGLLFGTMLGQRLAGPSLQRVFCITIVLVALWTIYRSVI